jgi:RNA polymerase sigma factor (sigma-70 family)
MGDTAAWTEFIHRMLPAIQTLVRRALRAQVGAETHEKDLIQNVILKLVSNNCAVLRRSIGYSDEEFRAYLARIARSVIRDFGRRQRAAKRPQENADQFTWEDVIEGPSFGSESTQERELLSRELIDLAKKVINRDSHEFSDVDYLIFVLYYMKGLTTSEIARCRGVGLSESAVLDAIDRLTERVRSETECGAVYRSTPATTTEDSSADTSQPCAGQGIQRIAQEHCARRGVSWQKAFEAIARAQMRTDWRLEFLLKLTPEQRYIVALRWGKGATYPAISSAVGKPRRHVAYQAILAKKKVLYRLDSFVSLRQG